MSWKIESVRHAEVAPEAVYALYADPATWSRWGHNATWARADGPLAEGGTVEVRANYGKVYACRIRRLVDGRLLVLEARPPALLVTQTYEVEGSADGAHVRHAIEVLGGLSGLLRIGGAPRLYRRLLDRELDKVIRLAGICWRDRRSDGGPVGVAVGATEHPMGTATRRASRPRLRMERPVVGNRP